MSGEGWLKGSGGLKRSAQGELGPLLLAELRHWTSCAFQTLLAGWLAGVKPILHKVVQGSAAETRGRPGFVGAVGA